MLHQFRQAYDYDRTEFGPVLGVAGGSRDAPRRRAARPGRARRGAPRVRHLAQRRRPAQALHRRRRRAPAAPAAGAAVPHRAEPEQFVLSVNRLDRAKRIDLLIEAAKARAVAPHRHRRRGPRPRAARGARRGDERPRRASPAASTTSALADLYARCLAVYYAPVDEDFGMVPYEAFLSEKPVVTTTDAGGPLEIVHDRETGLVVAPDAARARARRAPTCAAHARRGAGVGPAGKARRRARHVGRLHRRAARA